MGKKATDEGKKSIARKKRKVRHSHPLKVRALKRDLTKGGFCMEDSVCRAGWFPHGIASVLGFFNGCLGSLMGSIAVLVRPRCLGFFSELDSSPGI